MDMVISVIVLAIIAVVLIAAIKKKSISSVFKGAKHKIPIISFPNQSPKASPGMTIVPVDLEMYQLKSDGSYSEKFDLRKVDMTDIAGNMTGVSVSRPDANCEGILLGGKKKKNGAFDNNDEVTRAALSVSEKAITIGYDDKGFYGEVTSQKARVYTGTSSGDLKQVRFGEVFDINQGTYLLVGNQWLYFSIPSLPSFPGAQVAGNTSNTASPKTVTFDRGTCAPAYQPKPVHPFMKQRQNSNAAKTRVYTARSAVNGMLYR